MDMELIKQLALQVPALVVLAIIVYVFLNHIKDSQDNSLKRMSEMHDENMEARHQSRDIIQKNTEAWAKSLSVCDKMLEKMADVLEKRHH